MTKGIDKTKRVGGLRGFAVIAACCLGAMAFGAQYVANSGFEDVNEANVAAGWESAAEPFKVAKGEGYNGTTALKYDNDDPQAYVLPTQRVGLRPGGRYLVRAQIRTENLAGGNIGAGVGVEYAPGGSYSQSFTGTTRDWVQVCFTSDVPAWATPGRITVAPFVRRGCTGKAWFDEITITDLERPPLEVLSSSAYRNRAAGGTVAFVATLNLAETNGWKAAFTVRRAGFVKTLAAEKLTCACAAARIDVAELPVGESTVGFTLRDRMGKTVAEKEMTFVRFKGPDTRKVRFDARGRTIVDGKPFFPLGVYIDPRDKTALDEVAASPFNCVLPGEVLEPLLIFGECEKRGLKIIANLGEFYWGVGRTSAYASSEAAERALLARVNAVKDSPALLAWYTADEFPAHLAGVLERRRALLERLDPDHPTFAVTCHAGDVRRMFGAYEIVGSDPYPIGKNPDRDIAQAAKWAAAVRRGTFGIRPIWQVPQIFDWVAHWPEPGGSRAPTYAETRSMLWQAIAEGANGLVCYAHNSLKWAEKRGHDPYARRWEEVCRAAAEVKARIPGLLSAERPPRLGKLPPGLSARGWTKDGVRTVVFANQLLERLQGEIEVDGEKISFDLEPIGVEFKTL